MTTTVHRLSAQDWDTWYTTGWPAVVTGKEAEAFHRTVKPHYGMNAVDLACGNGKWTRQLAAWGVRVNGYDFSTQALRQAESANRRDGPSYARWDIDAEPIPPDLQPGSLDLVTCRHALPFLEHARVLTDVGRWLTPSGTFYALVRVTDDRDNDEPPAGGNGQAQNDPGLEPFQRGFTETRFAGLGTGWAHRMTYRLSTHTAAIVLRGYGSPGFEAMPTSPEPGDGNGPCPERRDPRGTPSNQSTESNC
ncbi:class I SAM-dependent methyltransferase [Streptomyces chartreusis]|uniref:class I SAM-dependent methyltransferase n=1 Tax=Streptomyces chartreusis TaxID=1969 RepID=UPI002E192073